MPGTFPAKSAFLHTSESCLCRRNQSLIDADHAHLQQLAYAEDLTDIFTEEVPG